MSRRLDLRAWAGRAWPEYDWAAARITHGAFHEVAVHDEVVCRMVVGSSAAERAEREAAILEAVTDVDLPVDVPTVVAPPHTADRRTGYLITRVHGALIEKSWTQVRHGYADLLAAFAKVRPAIAHRLPPVRAWCDPAIDLAPLIGFFGADAVARICESESLERAMHYRATLSLQVGAAAHLAGNQGLRDHAVANFVRRAEDGTTYDPGGCRPHGMPR